LTQHGLDEHGRYFHLLLLTEDKMKFILPLHFYEVVETV
jgi:hypothetical protein